jgi:hypothetical protein
MKNQTQTEQEKYYKQKNLNNKIKGFGCLFLIILVVVAVASNSNTPKGQKVGQLTPSVLNEDDKQADSIKNFKIGDIVVLNNNQILVKSLESCIPKFGKPEEGKKIVVIDITQENTGTEPVAYSGLSYKLQDNEDFTYDINFSPCKDPSFSGGTLQPKEKVRGYLHYQMPSENVPTKLIYTGNVWTNDQVIIELK